MERTPAAQMRVGGSRGLKIPLKPGHSQMDWLREKRKIMPPRPRGISLDELAKHVERNDAWLAIRGKVYNITPYLDFHPAGTAQIMRGAGKDATALFDEFHAWVNIDFMLDTCLIGFLESS